MALSAILLFAAVLAVAVATPGPTVAVLIARVLTLGPARNIGFAVGLVLGDIVWLATAVFGLAAVAEQAHGVMVALNPPNLDFVPLHDAVVQLKLVPPDGEAVLVAKALDICFGD